MTAGAKNDAAKLPWYLFPWDAAATIVAMLNFGAKKYAERNWEKGIAHSRTFAATIRHLEAWFQRREDNDPETGLPHLAHAACEVFFALALTLRGRVDCDDRPAATVPIMAGPCPGHVYSAKRKELAALVGADVSSTAEAAWECFLQGSLSWGDIEIAVGLTTPDENGRVSKKLFEILWAAGAP